MTSPPSGGSPAEAMLDQLWRNVLDDDYTGAEQRPPRRSGRVLSAVTLLAFGVLISTAAVQTRTDRPASALERAAVIDDIEARESIVAAQRQRVEELTAEVEELREAAETAEDDGRGIVSAADRPVVGPGIVITARSGRDGRGQISDLDLQLMVNGLWYAGAEAVAINGQRLGSTTAIRWAGESITVNYRSVSEPYTVTAIGPASLEENWTANPSGRHWQQRAEGSGLTWDIVADDALTLPAAPRARLRVTHATPLEEAP